MSSQGRRLNATYSPLDREFLFLSQLSGLASVSAKLPDTSDNFSQNKPPPNNLNPKTGGKSHFWGKVKVPCSGTVLRKKQGWTPRPAEKQAAPPRKKQALPRPAKLTNPVGRSGAKLTADSINSLFHDAHKDALQDERVGKSFHFTLFSEIPFKSFKSKRR